MTEKARLFDKRVIERNIDKGLISQQDVEEYMKSLPDKESESEVLNLDAEENEETEETAQDAENEQGFNFENDVESGPKNVYDF